MVWTDSVAGTEVFWCSGEVAGVRLSASEGHVSSWSGCVGKGAQADTL